MSRISRRRLEQELRTPAPAPPDDLGARIKAQIPNDLFAPGGEAPREDAVVPRRRIAPALAVAASLLVALGAGWLASRLYDERAAGRDAPASSSASPEEMEELDVRAPLAGGTDSAEAAAPARAAGAGSASAPPAPLQAAPSFQDRGRSAMQVEAGNPAEDQAGDPAEDPAIEAQNRRIRELEEEKRRLERAMQTQPGGAAGAPAAREDRGARVVSREDTEEAGVEVTGERGTWFEVGARPVSTLDVLTRPRSLGALLDEPGERAGHRGTVEVNEILDDLADDLELTTSSFAAAAAPTPVEGRVVLVVAGVVTERGAPDATAPDAAAGIELVLDPAAAIRYRLLASHAHALRPDETTGGGSPVSAARYRLAALLEIETDPDRPRGARLGTVRPSRGAAQRDEARTVAPRTRAPGETAVAPEREPGRSPRLAIERRAAEIAVAAPEAGSTAELTIGAGELAASWEAARPELRLALLAAELARAPAGGTSLDAATIEAELRRLAALPESNPEVASRAARLLAARGQP